MNVVPCEMSWTDKEEDFFGAVPQHTSSKIDLQADKMLMIAGSEKAARTQVRSYTMRFRDKTIDHEFHETMFGAPSNVHLRTNFCIMGVLWIATWASYMRLFFDVIYLWLIGAVALLSILLVIVSTFKDSSWGRRRQYATIVCMGLAGTSINLCSVWLASVKEPGKDMSASQETAQLTAIYLICVLCVVTCGFCNLRTMQTACVELVLAVSFSASLPYYLDLASENPYSFSRNIVFLLVILFITFMIAGEQEHRQQKLFLHNRKLVNENDHIRLAADRLRTKMAVMQTQVRRTQTQQNHEESVKAQMKEMATDGTLFKVFMKSQEDDASPEIKKHAKDVLEKFMSAAEDTDDAPQIQMAASAIEVARLWMNRMVIPVVTRDEVIIFLGGSCNPTTWRMDMAIPFFSKNQIQYYNPQVEEWYAELAAEEATAKEDAFVLLFVIDKQTRALASVLEATEHICRGRILVLVIENVDKGARMSGSKQPIDDAQCDDLNRARAYLRDVCDRHGVITYTNVEDGCKAVLQLVNDATSLTQTQTKKRILRKHKSSHVLSKRVPPKVIPRSGSA